MSIMKKLLWIKSIDCNLKQLLYIIYHYYYKKETIKIYNYENIKKKNNCVNNLLSRVIVKWLFKFYTVDAIYQSLCSQYLTRKMDIFDKRYCTYRTMLKIVGLWPYNNSIYVWIQRLWLLIFFLGNIIFQVIKNYDFSL